MSEAKIQKSILKALELQGYWAFRVNSGQKDQRQRGAPAGTPDICVVYPPGWLEVKQKGGALSGSQQAWHQRAYDYELNIATVTSATNAVHIVREWANDRKNASKRPR